MDIRFDRITRNPDVTHGQPCIRGLRITVRRVLEAMLTFPVRTELMAEYRELEETDLQQALESAEASLDERVVELRKASQESTIRSYYR